MAVPFAEDALLVSSPNQGGMILISDGKVIVLDKDDSTGVWVSEENIYRNIIVGSGGSKSMQLHAYSATYGRKVLAVDSHYDFHDILLYKDNLYLVSTGTNEVFVLDQEGNEIRRYSFPGHHDSWHINCLGIWDGRVVLSAFGEFDSHRGYKHHSRNNGFVIDIERNIKLWQGLSQPHSPAENNGKLFICNSEEKQLLVNDRAKSTISLQFDGYTRGLAFSEHYIYVGLSQSRNITETSTATSGARIVALDSSNFEYCGEIHLPFTEIYDVRLINKSNLLPIVMVSINSIALKQECAILTAELDNMRAQFKRTNEHYIAGTVIKLLRWLKKDSSFGNPNTPSSID